MTLLVKQNDAEYTVIYMEVMYELSMALTCTVILSIKGKKGA